MSRHGGQTREHKVANTDGRVIRVFFLVRGHKMLRGATWAHTKKKQRELHSFIRYSSCPDTSSWESATVRFRLNRFRNGWTARFRLVAAQTLSLSVPSRKKKNLFKPSDLLHGYGEFHASPPLHNPRFSFLRRYNHHSNAEATHFFYIIYVCVCVSCTFLSFFSS